MKVLIIILILLLSTTLQAQVHVKGHYRKNGTYVAPHIRSAPDSTKSNNYGRASSFPQYGSKRGYADPNTRDSDRDGIANQYDDDDDNDGILDDDE